VSDYRKLFAEFGIEEFDEILEEVPNPHYLMRRGVIFGHRDYRPVAKAMREGEEFAALSGFMPTGDPHIGHKLVFDEIIWHQQQGGDAYALIADLEAHSARGLSWDEIDEHSRNYLLSLLALGFDPEDGELYRQSDNREVQDLAFELGAEANVSEMGAIYDFDGETDISHMQSVVTQMADILYPRARSPNRRSSRSARTRTPTCGWPETWPRECDSSASRGPTPASGSRTRNARYSTTSTRTSRARATTLTPPTRTTTRSAASRPPRRCARRPQPLRVAGPRPGHSRRPRGEARKRREGAAPAPDPLSRPQRDRGRLEALIDAVAGEKRVYDEHVDSFELSREDAEELAREVELDHGGYGFLPPSSIYHRFMTGLTGGKMSSSIPASHISLLDDPGTATTK